MHNRGTSHIFDKFGMFELTLVFAIRMNLVHRVMEISIRYGQPFTVVEPLFLKSGHRFLYLRPTRFFQAPLNFFLLVV